jgi:hypothetical protein
MIYLVKKNICGAGALDGKRNKMKLNIGFSALVDHCRSPDTGFWAFGEATVSKCSPCLVQVT